MAIDEKKKKDLELMKSFVEDPSIVFNNGTVNNRVALRKWINKCRAEKVVLDDGFIVRSIELQFEEKNYFGATVLGQFATAWAKETEDKTLTMGQVDMIMRKYFEVPE